MNKAIKNFWSWFTDYQAKLKNLRSLTPKDQKHYTFWLNHHLHLCTSGVDYILIFPKGAKQEMTLIITANGNPAFFKLVESIVKTAPQIYGWKFTAFVQPTADYEEMESKLDHPYVLQDITLKVSDLKFVPFHYEDEKKIDMVIYLKNFTIYSHNKNLLQLIYIMMQDLIGEKLLYETINFIELAQEENGTGIEQIYLYDLQFYLEGFNTQYNDITH